MAAPIPLLAELPVLEVPPIIPAILRARGAWRPGRSLRPIRASRAPACARDGLALDQHPACLACGILAGPLHPLAAFLDAGLCVECRA